MYQTSSHKTTPKNNHRLAFSWLLQMGFDRSHIRRAFGKLTGISQADIARMHRIDRLTVAKNITGERRQAAVQQLVADAWSVPVDIAFKQPESLSDTISGSHARERAKT